MVIPITRETVGNLKLYLDLFHKSTNNDDFLIYTTHGGNRHKMSTDNVQGIIRKYTDMIRDSLKQISKENQEDLYAVLSPDERNKIKGQF